MPATQFQLSGRLPLSVLLVTALAVGACDRERRVFREVPPGATAFPAVQATELQAGPTTIDPVAGAYRENRWAVSQGQMLFTQYNCAGCHAPGGGGGMGFVRSNRTRKRSSSPSTTPRFWRSATAMPASRRKTTTSARSIRNTWRCPRSSATSRLPRP